MWWNQEPTCKFCNDRGCIACDGERYRKTLDKDGNPVPIFVAKLDDPDQLAQLKDIFGRNEIVARLDAVGGDMAKFVEETGRLAEDAMSRRGSDTEESTS